MAQMLGAAKLLFIVMIIAGINMWEWLGQETPSWWTWFVNNKIYACMMVHLRSPLMMFLFGQSWKQAVYLSHQSSFRLLTTTYASIKTQTHGVKVSNLKPEYSSSAVSVMSGHVG
ncbi:hypothetical protein O3P69_007907 [Scylla paramamosain]|uniref:Uncharacterized protein n=1 Tax=Scylla paramamosain TaxID=85552 RepID=A0AAW0T007_SCYPA